MRPERNEMAMKIELGRNEMAIKNHSGML